MTGSFTGHFSVATGSYEHINGFFSECAYSYCGNFACMGTAWNACCSIHVLVKSLLTLMDFFLQVIIFFQGNTLLWLIKIQFLAQLLKKKENYEYILYLMLMLMKRTVPHTYTLQRSSKQHC